MYLRVFIFVVVVLPQAGDRDPWLDLYQENAEKIKVTLADENESQVQLNFVSQPVLNWSNDVRFGNTNGAVYVWTHQGRVATVGTVFSHANRSNPEFRHIARSMLKLCKGHVSAQVDDVTFWSPTDAGMLHAELLDEPAVKGSRVARLVQMRSIASEFSAEIVDYDGVDRQLRLMPSPVFRYADPDGKDGSRHMVLDGALFVFATEGTDPEVLLLLEALETVDGLKWHFSIGRFTTTVVTVSRKGKVIWNPPKTTEGTNYRTFRFDLIEGKSIK